MEVTSVSFHFDLLPGRERLWLVVAAAYMEVDERGVGGVAGGPGYTKEDDAHAFKTAHEIPRGDENTGSGLTGSRNTGSGLTGTGSGLAGGSSNAGPHDSNAANKLDPRVDSDRDGRSGVSGSNTQSQSGIGETLSKTAAAVTGDSVGGASAQHDNRGTTSGNNNNLGEYSMKDATEHATSQHQVGQPGIADAEHRGDTHKHQGANDPLDQPGHRDTHAIRDTKNQAERRLDPSTDAPGSHGPESSTGPVGQNPDSVRHGSLTGHLPGAPGGQGLQKTSTGEGTGKEYVKSTGLRAEGGDFDASRPGAGKEADSKSDCICLCLWYPTIFELKETRRMRRRRKRTLQQRVFKIGDEANSLVS